jgi:hypothetical protein
LALILVDAGDGGAEAWTSTTADAWSRCAESATPVHRLARGDRGDVPLSDRPDAQSALAGKLESAAIALLP